MGLVACLKVVFDSGACGWLEMNPLPSPGQKKALRVEVLEVVERRSPWVIMANLFIPFILFMTTPPCL